jgi:hypothetical protein
VAAEFRSNMPCHAISMRLVNARYSAGAGWRISKPAAASGDEAGAPVADVHMIGVSTLRADGQTASAAGVPSPGWRGSDASTAVALSAVACRLSAP